MSGLVEFSKSVGVVKRDKKTYAEMHSLNPRRPNEFNSRKQNVAREGLYGAALGAGVSAAMDGRLLRDVYKNPATSNKAKLMILLNGPKSVARRAGKFGLAIGALNAAGGAVSRHKGSKNADKSREAAERYLSSSRDMRRAYRDYKTV